MSWSQLSEKEREREGREKGERGDGKGEGKREGEDDGERKGEGTEGEKENNTAILHALCEPIHDTCVYTYYVYIHVAIMKHIVKFSRHKNLCIIYVSSKSHV